MAAAAAVLLSTLAGLLAVRTEREMPSFTEAPQTAQAPVASSAAPTVADSATAPPRSEPVPAVPRVAREAARVEESQRAPTPPTASNRAARADAPAQPQRSIAAAKPAEAEAPRDARGRSNEDVSVDASSEPRAKMLKEESAPATEAPSAGVRAAPEAFRTEPAPAVTPAPIAREKKDGVTTLSKARQQTPAASNATGAIGGASPSAPASEVDTTSAPRPEEWLEKIIRLRRNGQHVDADAELKQFRERYPQVQVPPEALGPSGTR
jgi:hypothetical protein